jgi:hypothetical protein
VKYSFAIIILLLLMFKTRAGDTTNYIQGIVKQKSDAAPLYAATIMLLGQRGGVISGKAGYYKINIPDSLINRKVILQVSYLGYYRYQKEVYLNGKLPLTINPQLEEKKAVIDTMPSFRRGIIGRAKSKRYRKRLDKMKKLYDHD